MNAVRRRGHGNGADNDATEHVEKIRPVQPPAEMQGPVDYMAGWRRLTSMERERAAFMAKFIGEAEQ